jgi:hypothetical protein
MEELRKNGAYLDIKAIVKELKEKEKQKKK